MGQSDGYVILQRHREQSHNVQGQRLGSVGSDQHLFVGSGNILQLVLKQKHGVPAPGAFQGSPVLLGKE